MKHFPGEMEPEPVPDPGSRAAVQIHSGAAAGMLEPEPEAVAGSVAVVVLLPEAGAGAGSRGRIHPPELEPGPSPGSREKGRKMAYISMLSGSYRYYIKPLPKKSAVSGPDLQAVPIHSGAAVGKLEPEPVPDPGSRAAVVLLEAGSHRRAE